MLNKSLSGYTAGIGMLALCTQVVISGAYADVSGVESGLTNAPIAQIEGNTVTNDDLSSFAIQLEQSEGMRSPSSEALLNEYILTQLYDKIPTTATISAADAESTVPTDQKLVSQRALLKRELRNSLTDTIEIPRADMQAWYDQNSEKYTKPERIHAWHIFMETSEDTPSSAPEAVRTRLQGLKQQADSGTSFSQLAKEQSEAASGQAGGEIGKITRRMPIGPLSKPMNLELENALFALSPGKVSDLVDTRHGMHLLYVTEKETTSTPSLDDLISSGILPGVLAQDRLTSELQSLVVETVEKYGGVVLPESGMSATTGTVSEINNETIAFRLDGKDFTIGHLMSMFGPRFTSYLESSKQDPEALKGLMEQALEDEAMVRAAVDKGVANNPETAKELELLGQRETARKVIDAIVTAEADAAVTDETIQNKYDELKEELRQPEAEGAVLLIQSEIATGTAEQARAREQARELAEKVHADLQNSDFTSVTRQLLATNAERTSVTQVPRHLIGQSTDTQTRIFDQAVSGIQGESGLSEVTPIAADYAIANLEKRYPGEPVALPVVRDRIETLLKGAAQADVRMAIVQRLEKEGLVKFLPGAAEFGKNLATSAADELTTAAGANQTTTTQQ